VTQEVETNTSSEAILSEEQANSLVVENQGWAESIARSVARAWNLDWRLDGLDGAAMEALIFCSRRFQPNRGVPFRGYARRRVHEASTEAARKTKAWHKGLGTQSSAQQQARDISAELLTIFPELRNGQLPFIDEAGGDSEGDVRGAIRQLLVGASFIAARQGINTSTPDDVMDYKRMITIVSSMEPVHQLIIWKVYWEGASLRNIASEWETDELNVIREHKSVLAYLYKQFSNSKTILKPKIRPGLRPISIKLRKEGKPGVFSGMLKANA
jgi:DNA-directed RNA polymerase specialized sigma subunit